ncbi:unnamed protein product [Euphydryas editha]|uniref:DDE Tnp4 domain-containing protein n=1 Tax=Euphydryas editha TaxID=104508 RepID=A0AAU9U731_EUPED|nr:unnamed protein product [Euphydryas editha]
MPKTTVCDCCHKRTVKSNLRVVKNPYFIEYLKRINKNVHSGYKICKSCFTIAYKNCRIRTLRRSKNIDVSLRCQSTESSPIPSKCEDSSLEIVSNVKVKRPKTNGDQTVRLSLPRVTHDHKQCFICKRRDKCLKTVPVKAKCHFYIQKGFLIPPGARCCQIHLNMIFKSEDISNVTPSNNDTVMNTSDIKQLLEELRAFALKAGLDFDTPGLLNDDDYWILTGLRMKDFNELYTIVKDKMRNTHIRSIRTSLAVFLMKLRTGLSYKVLSTLFCLPKIAVSRCISTVRDIMMSEFVPKYLGVDHVSREDFMKMHTRPFAKELFCPNEEKVIVVADGTYIYIEKSGNYRFQRRTYSLHKGRPLVKPMMIVSTTGYILEILGPYFADGRNNDASILKSQLNDSSSTLRSWLREDDIIVVDRGFRDCLSLLQDMQLVAKMPSFLGSRQQHTDEEANESRLITSVRWVVEATNGLLKTWKALGNVMANSHIPHIGDYVRIVAALCNAYRPPRKNIEEDERIMAQRMIRLSRQSNTLKIKVEEKGWIKKRVIWKEMSADDLQDFPRLMFQELCDLTMGIYQLKQAKSYTKEHIDNQGLYKIFLHKESSDILRIKIQSRHTASKIYSLWIQYNSTTVLNWYCQCKVGARVVGCCAHIASVIWYLTYDRYQDHSTRRVLCDYNNYLMDADVEGHWSDNNEENGD